MVISIASGKGGTGKTTIAASLASVLEDSVYLDCDVEEPNGHLLLKPGILREDTAVKPIPRINTSICTLCGKCVEVCEFNALINFKTEILLFEEMCHSCGACKYFCPSNAIIEEMKSIGVVRTGINETNITFAGGLLDVGVTTSVPLIKKVKEYVVPGKINIIDSPPGTSCLMLESVKESDYCILVTESTMFGLNDLKLAVTALQFIGIPFGVVINKHIAAFTELDDYLAMAGIDLLLKIPFDKRFAVSYSEGILPVNRYPELKGIFTTLYKTIINKLDRYK